MLKYIPTPALPYKLLLERELSKPEKHNMQWLGILSTKTNTRSELYESSHSFSQRSSKRLEIKKSTGDQLSPVREVVEIMEL